MLLFFLFMCLDCVISSDIFHVDSKLTFDSGDKYDYFGYTVVFSEIGLYIGAPKAKLYKLGKTIAPGQVFRCNYDGFSNPNVTCQNSVSNNKVLRENDFFKDDMWFGATMTYIPIGRLLICAPRVRDMLDKYINYLGTDYLANGICVIQTSTGTKILRNQYKKYSHGYFYFTYGQSGFSAKWAGRSRLITGAPGAMNWRGTMVSYTNKSVDGTDFTPLPIVNPYYTPEIGEYDIYNGYSVEAGVFEKTGRILHVTGAPRSSNNYGEVFLIDPVGQNEYNRFKIKESLTGPQLGSYFGSSLCTVDLDGDGLSDLLVGAPNYVQGKAHFDQGAVFVYLSRQWRSKLTLEAAGFVAGSESSGARFGTAIASIGDIDGDGHNDVAIGAPYDQETGAVYIYRGNLYGLNQRYSQRISPEGAKGFGFSISSGYDADKNECNDIVIGAYNSSTAYLYRCIPTIKVIASIRILDTKNSTHFTALFCVHAPPRNFKRHLYLDMTATITTDPEFNRVQTFDNSKYQIVVSPRYYNCSERILELKNETDLSRPIVLKFELKPTRRIEDDQAFPTIPRTSEDSVLSHSTSILMLTDCGDDMVCTPKLEMHLKALDSPYIPGTDSTMKIIITVLNREEPAYSVKMAIALPYPPIRLPRSCSLRELNMTCDLPQPLNRNKTAEWELELEYSWQGSDEELKVVASLEDPLYGRNVSVEPTKELVIPIMPIVKCHIGGTSKPNDTILVSRDVLYNSEDYAFFLHTYKVSNEGPSDLYHIEATIAITQVIIDGALFNFTETEEHLEFEPDLLPAKGSIPYELPVHFNLSQYAEYLEDSDSDTLNVTSKIEVFIKYGTKSENLTMELTTILVVQPKTPIWPLIVGIVFGLLLLAAITLGLYKLKFFSRQKKEDLKQLIEETSAPAAPSSSNNGYQSMDADKDQMLSDSDVELS